MNDGPPPKRDELADAEALYQVQCTKANEVLYATVKAAHTSDELEAAYVARPAPSASSDHHRAKQELPCRRASCSKRA